MANSIIDATHGHHAGDELLRAFAAMRVPAGAIELATTASFGVASADFRSTQAVTPQALIAATDELTYEAKRSGRNRVWGQQLVPHTAQPA